MRSLQKENYTETDDHNKFVHVLDSPLTNFELLATIYSRNKKNKLRGIDRVTDMDGWIDRYLLVSGNMAHRK